jgi:2-polyprenyl-3-methyl-5-hydroxy-6-metoxy-1,4-benzoquinol methylase
LGPFPEPELLARDPAATWRWASAGSQRGPIFHDLPASRPLTISRIWTAARVRALGAAIDAGVLAYRPIEKPDRRAWEEAHGQGQWDRLAGLQELSRYSLIVGYVRFFGPARSILDVGCGHGVDVATTAIDRAKRLEDSERIRFAVGELPPADAGRFHFIVCNEVLYYLADPAESLQRIRSLLDPDGYLLTSVWRHRGDAALHRLIARSYTLVDSVQSVTLMQATRVRTRVSCWRPRV